MGHSKESISGGPTDLGVQSHILALEYHTHMKLGSFDLGKITKCKYGAPAALGGPKPYLWYDNVQICSHLGTRTLCPYDNCNAQNSSCRNGIPTFQLLY